MLLAFAWRRSRPGALFVAVWLVTGLLVLSFMPDLKVRYVEVLAPPVALALGAGVVSLRLPGVLTWVALAALLLAPTAKALQIVRSGVSDSGHLGAMTPAEAARLSAFLGPRTGGMRWELASATAAKAAPLIERDDRPVLMLQTEAGHPLTRLARFKRDVARGQVRYVLLAGRCGPHSALAAGGCGADARWALVHGVDVSALAGLAHGSLILTSAPVVRTEPCSRSSSSTTSRRCASHSPARSGVRATRRSRSRTAVPRSTARRRTASTSSCLTWPWVPVPTATRSAARSATAATPCRSSCSPRSTARPTSCSGSRRARTTTSPNRSVWLSCAAGSAPCSAVRLPARRT